jgi:hypothetical protein
MTFDEGDEGGEALVVGVSRHRLLPLAGNLLAGSDPAV